MDSHTRNAADDDAPTGEIQSMADLLLADFADIEFAMVKLTQEAPKEIRGGRVVARDSAGGLRLRRNGHTHSISNPKQWNLERYKPITTAAERRAIEADWGEQ